MGKRGPKPMLEMSVRLMRQVRALAKLGCPKEEAAACLGVGRTTFFNFIAEHPEIDEVWEQGVLEGNASLRRKQFQTAMGGNVSMMIWLGKNRLKQSDQVPDGSGVAEEMKEFLKEFEAIDGNEGIIPADSDEIEGPGMAIGQPLLDRK